MEEKDKEKEKETPVIEKVKEETEKVISGILTEGIKSTNIDFLYKAIDIHKDIANEEYWKSEKEEKEMRYRNSYGEYGESMGNYGNYGEYNESGSYGRGRYNESGSYGRRGVKGTGRGRYRGHEMLEEMQESYGAYSEGREQYSRSGNYGAKEDTMKSLDYMMKSVVQFIEMLQDDASSQEEVSLIKKYTKKISEM